MWDIDRGYVTNRGSTKSFFVMMRTMGFPDAVVRAERRDLQKYWEDAAKFIHKYYGGIHAYIQAMVQRSLQTVPRLWEGTAQTWRSEDR